MVPSSFNDTMLNICQSLFRELDEAEVNYCHWKSNINIDKTVSGETDIDLLVDYKREQRVRNILASLGYKHLQTSTYASYPAIDDYVGLDKSGQTVHLHLHYRLVMGKPYLKEYRIPWEKEILYNRVKDDKYDIYKSSPEYELLLILIRYCLKIRWRNYPLELFGKPLIRGQTKNEYKELKKEVDRESLVSLSENLLNAKSAGIIHSLYDNPSIWSLRKLLKTLPDIFQDYRRHTRTWGEVVAKKRESQAVVVHIVKKFLPRRTFPYKKILDNGGISVAIIGADGSGKSTVSQAVADELGWQIDTIRFYFGHGDGSDSLWLIPLRLENKMSNILLTNNTDTSSTSESNTYKKDKIENSQIIKIWKSLRSFPISMDKRKKLKQMNMARNNGVIAICDRYPNVNGELPDSPHLNHWKSSGNYLMSKLGKFEEHPYIMSREYEPDIVIKLNVSPEEAVRRKEENDMKRAKKRIKEVNQVRFEGANVFNIDANKPLSEVVNNTLQIVWSEM